MHTAILYTEQMDAEGLGRGLLLTPLGTPPKVPKKQTAGTVTASHNMLTLQAMPALQREALRAKERLLGDLRQSVPQNGRVHLLGVEILGLEMGAPILLAPGILLSFCRKTSMSRKILVSGGGGVVFFLGGGSADSIFMGAGIFLVAA